ncbi:hypothetical protein [Cyclobacterium amurskyense]|jgi:hypothetical protein|uniref:HPt domain-containing protein n=1 Tax=Cyclobacterium amurskyense TaxID=320787 RepID=A0A0H4PHD6_9BACT|nr:hypothetical protein [Cyclobacterium amurskyense]AKP53584.1 hypothetical protein CA2015_4236 [Cyclobacterium amurskyense]|tara:strand:- start:190 stop:537 length:348 start_codon:yes stop_codon:yes gene_type:complete
MEGNLENIDFIKIEEMVEDDLDFRNQLLDAIEIAVEELESAYLKGIDAEDLELIKQARHKIKPTLALFGLKRISHILALGKGKMLDDGFGPWIEAHRLEFKEAALAILTEVRNYR